MSPFDEQAGELLAAAERDLVTYRILRRDASAPLETTLFHAQQALEKQFKAVLVGRGVVFPRTHDLYQLHDMALKNGVSVPVAAELLVRLAPYAVEFRYLGVKAPDVSLAETDLAVETMVGWCEKELKS
jgi:HEPN domain-containing protein